MAASLILERAIYPCILLSLCLGLVSVLAAPTNPPAGRAASHNIGIEGHVTVVLPKGDYRPRPLDDRTELILRIESVTGKNDRFHYDFHYIGFEAGAYKLADYLIRPDGTRPEEIGNTLITVRALLPEDHNGQLIPYAPRLFPFAGGYRLVLGLLAALWVGGLGVFAWRNRRRRVIAPIAVVPQGPTLAEQLRPLVEAAAAGKLATDGQAQLERLLTGYWREKLALPDLRMAEALARLKAHPEAGELLRAMERWLHRPGGVSHAEITALLAPYHNLGPARLDQGGVA